MKPFMLAKHDDKTGLLELASHELDLVAGGIDCTGTDTIIVRPPNPNPPPSPDHLLDPPYDGTECDLCC